MFRRIEVLPPFPEGTWLEGWHKKAGVNLLSGDLMRDLGLEAPSLGGLAHQKRITFFFTMEGWERVGRQVLASLTQIQCRVRVIAVKEHEREVVYRDPLQVVLRPRKKFQTKRRR